MRARYSPFSRDVFEARIARAREVMRKEKLDACLVVMLEHLYYFGGYDCWVGVNSPQAIVLTKGADSPTLIVRNVDLPLATETSFIEDIRTYHLNTDDVPALFKEILKEKGVARGRVGIEMQSAALTYSLGKAIADALHGMELVDTTVSLGRLRIIKSAEELTLMERAGRIAEAGLAVFRRACKPGISELALSGEIEAALRQAGSDYWSIPIELASGDRSAGGHGTARERRIETGDLVHVELAGVASRYHATAIQTLACGKPGKRSKEIHDLGIASLEAGIAAIRRGANAHEIEVASLEPLARHGLAHAAMMRFGYGLGIAYPPIWLEPLTIGRGFDTKLEPGMTFVLHSCIELPGEGLGVIQGGTYCLEEGGGLRMLAGAGAVDLLVT
jgi:Xaa-Pro aminopeptidase